MTETEEDDKVVNYDPKNVRLIYASLDGASRSVDKETKYLNLAPRLGMISDLLGDQTAILRTGLASPTTRNSRRRRT